MAIVRRSFQTPSSSYYKVWYKLRALTLGILAGLSRRKPGNMNQNNTEPLPVVSISVPENLDKTPKLKQCRGTKQAVSLYLPPKRKSGEPKAFYSSSSPSSLPSSFS